MSQELKAPENHKSVSASVSAVSYVRPLKTLDQLDEFVHESIKRQVPLIIKCTGSFCGPCHAIQPLYEKLAQHYQESGIFAISDVNKDSEVCDVLYNEDTSGTVPMFHVSRNGTCVEYWLGANPQQLVERIQFYCDTKSVNNDQKETNPKQE